MFSENDAIHRLSAAELSRRLAAGVVSAQEVAQALLERVRAVDPQVRAVLTIDEDEVLRQAGESDARRLKGELRGPLDGIPVGIKDVIAVKGQKLTCASRMLENFVSPYDATVTSQLRAAGAVLFGRLNMDEFAMGSSTENSAFVETANPWDLSRAPGGSSGGSAAAVAAGMVPLSLGSDTGGSIRQPAAFCGIVGLKPTYGRVSRYGLVAFASSLDQIGPMARSVEDAALLLQAISGPDPRDSTSFDVEVPDYAAALRGEPRPLRIGVPSEYFGPGLDDGVRAAVEAAVDFYRHSGCEIVDVHLPHTELAIPVYYIIATAEASSNLARYDGVRYGHRSERAKDMIDLHFKSRGEGFGEEVKRRIILGTYVLSSGYYDAYYLRAQKVRSLIREDFLRAFDDVDVILTPTTPTPAFLRGEKKSDPLSMYLADIFTISANLAGLPAMSLPCATSADGLPIGFQLTGKPFGEAGLLAVAHAFEQSHAFAHRQPDL